MRLIDADALDVNEIPCFYSDECYLEDVQKWIDSAPTVEPKRGEWISVKEMLPEYNPAGTAKAYWVAYDTNKGKQIQIALYSHHMLAATTELPLCVTWRDYGYHKIKNVTHWMPLPEPPQEDKP